MCRCCGARSNKAVGSTQQMTTWSTSDHQTRVRSRGVSIRGSLGGGRPPLPPPPWCSIFILFSLPCLYGRNIKLQSQRQTDLGGTNKRSAYVRLYRPTINTHWKQTMRRYIAFLEMLNNGRPIFLMKKQLSVNFLQCHLNFET